MQYTSIFKHAMPFGLAVVICVTPPHLLAQGDTKSPQAEVPASMGAADKAYREVATKDYKTAIQDFQTALTAEPSNTQWRKDLGFTHLAAGLTQDALSEFQKVHAEHPEDSGTVLQLGYLYASTGKWEEAKEMFTAAGRDADPEVIAKSKAGLERGSARLKNMVCFHLYGALLSDAVF